MYKFESHVTVKLEFPAMPTPVEVSIPWNVLPYLEAHADRRRDSDGEVIYIRPRRLEVWLAAVAQRPEVVCSLA